MTRDDFAETLIGLVVVLVAAAFFVFAAQRGGLQVSGAEYTIHGDFSNVDGVTPGTEVRLSGVKIGAVTGLTLLPDKANWVRVDVAVQASVKIPADSTARVISGLLGGTHLAIESGGSEELLAQGGVLMNTEGAVDIFTLFEALTSNNAAADAPPQ